jgi:hypothetical protein
MPPHPGLYLVLVDEPGKDLYALPGFFYDPALAIEQHVSFQAHPRAARFLIVQVTGQVGPVGFQHALGGTDQAIARARASLPSNPAAGAAGLPALAVAPAVPAFVPACPLGDVLVLGQKGQGRPQLRLAVACSVAVGVSNRLCDESRPEYYRAAVLADHSPSRRRHHV